MPRLDTLANRLKYLPRTLALRPRGGKGSQTGAPCEQCQRQRAKLHAADQAGPGLLGFLAFVRRHRALLVLLRFATEGARHLTRTRTHASLTDRALAG